MRTLIPTPAELAALAVLWERGPSTVREIHTHLGAGTGYTTVLRTVQIMTEKGLVTQNKSTHAHVFTASAPASETLCLLMTDLLQRAFGGDCEKFLKYAHEVARGKDSPDSGH